MTNKEIDETLNNLKVLMQEIKNKCVKANGLDNTQKNKMCKSDNCPFIAKNHRCGLSLKIYYSNIHQRPIRWDIDKLFEEVC